MVAEGSAHLYPRIAPTCEWDTAAAHAVVRAAGGEVFVYDPQVAAKEYVTEQVNLKKVGYNKSDILNPYFIVSGLHKYNA
jgi:3'(2'), 5'-bisphosphate nucleotidase